jgi:hypothetical protein
MKTCTKCFISKLNIEYYKQNNNSKDGYQSHCKKCDNVRKKKWKVLNPELAKIHADKAEHNRRDDQKRIQYRKELKKLPHIKVTRNAAYAKRRAAKINRSPKWVTKNDEVVIKAFYAIAQMLSRVNGEAWHVDHDIPLQAKLASGLHVPSNLRLMRGIENETKRNTYYIN